MGNTVVASWVLLCSPFHLNMKSEDEGQGLALTTNSPGPMGAVVHHRSTIHLTPNTYGVIVHVLCSGHTCNIYD
jgi:hypothetical protein